MFCTQVNVTGVTHFPCAVGTPESQSTLLHSSAHGVVSVYSVHVDQTPPSLLLFFGRHEDALAVVNGIVGTYGSEAAANPNLLEYNGNGLLSRQPEKGGSSVSRTALSRPSSVPGARCAFRSGAATSAAGHNDLASSVSPMLTPTVPDVKQTVVAVADDDAVAVEAAVRAARAAPRCGCLGRAIFSSLAVNRVQSTYSTPVYTSREGGLVDLDRRLWSRLSKMERHRARGEQRGDGGDWQLVGDVENKEDVGGWGWAGGFDGSAYRWRAFNAVHVGELWFQDGRGGRGAATNKKAASLGGGEVHDEKEIDLNGLTRRIESAMSVEAGRRDRDAGKDAERWNGSGQSVADRGFGVPRRLAIAAVPAGGRIDTASGGAAEQRATVTVLLPVKNGGAHLLDAMESVIACARRTPPDCQVELLIVDDGSEDGAVEKTLAVVNATVDGGQLAEPRNGADGKGGAGTGGDLDRANDEGGRERRGGVGTASPKEARGICANDVGIAVDGVGLVADGATANSDASSIKYFVDLRRGRSCCVVRVIRHSRTLGLAESLNEGLREATGDLVARMDADDVCMPDRLCQQVLRLYLFLLCTRQIRASMTILL